MSVCRGARRSQVQPEIHSTPRREASQIIVEQTKQRLQISELHFDKFPTPTTEECTCLQFPTEAILWIKEVDLELVKSVDDLKSSHSIKGTPDFELLDARIASALNKSSRMEMKADKEDRFLRGRQIAYLIYEYFRVCRELCRSLCSRSSR